ncbi:MAG TPA: class I SAM-dependent methyltransferase [Gemmatimonadaceae bacterium]|nr:class I SAM-dependent methyltransferase [Gemmatimonadaceae bacterium]
MSDADLTALEASLRRRFRVVESTVDIGGRSITILHPASAEDLIDETDFARDERLPYWAELWPSAKTLAERIMREHGTDRTLIELGCGSGLVATCASLAGFRVVASDYYEDATRFARVNARRNGAAAPRPLLLDWRALPPAADRYDVVVASDVLHERAYGELVARAILALLRPGGVALVADPGRVAREDIVRALPELGLAVNRRDDVAFVDGPIRQTITIFEIAWRA